MIHNFQSGWRIRRTSGKYSEKDCEEHVDRPQRDSKDKTGKYLYDRKEENNQRQAVKSSKENNEEDKTRKEKTVVKCLLLKWCKTQ